MVIRKKIITAILSGILLFIFCSCGGKIEIREYTSGNLSKSDQVIRWGGILTTPDGVIENAFKEVAEEYQKLNPGIRINLEFLNASDYSHNRTWLVTQLVGGTAPDILQTWHDWAKEDCMKGLVIDLKPYIQQEYAYGEKGKRWVDHFHPELIIQNKDNTTGAYPSVPLATVAVKVIYNKELFEKAGIKRLPETMTEMIELCRRLKDKNITPFIFPNASPGDSTFNWMHRMFMDQMIEPLIPLLDLDNSSFIEMNEIAAGVDKGIIDLEKSPWNSSPPLIKEFSKYFIKDFNGLDRKTSNELFNKGEGAMIIEWAFALKGIAENKNRKFEFGIFPFPYLTKAESPFAVEKLYEMGGAPQMNMCVPASIREESLKSTIDFLQFLCSPHAAKILGEKAWVMSSLKDIISPPQIGNFVITGKTSSLRLLSPIVSKELYEDDSKVGKLYLEEKVTLEEFNAVLNADLRQVVDQQKKLNDWSEMNNWGLKKDK